MQRVDLNRPGVWTVLFPKANFDLGLEVGRRFIALAMDRQDLLDQDLVFSGRYFGPNVSDQVGARAAPCRGRRINQRSTVHNSRPSRQRRAHSFHAFAV